MGWSVGYDEDWQRWIGYGVPSICDHPECENEIDRGLAHVCGGEPYGGEEGCGLYFCEARHLFCNDNGKQCCDRCIDGKEPYEPTPDTEEWIKHQQTDPSWAKWREENGRGGK